MRLQRGDALRLYFENVGGERLEESAVCPHGGAAVQDQLQRGDDGAGNRPRNRAGERRLLRDKTDMTKIVNKWQNKD